MIGAHEPIRIAFGPTIQGYTADVVRMLCIGKGRADYVRLQDAFLEAQGTLIKMLCPGAKASALLMAVEEIYTRRGVRDFWSKRIGHSVGLSVHEPPRIVSGSEVVLSEGMVVAIEPGLVVPGLGGYWQCDVFVITPSGPQLLTEGPQGTILAALN
jgi:Xaa-Pro aminopeptidase